MFNIFTKRNSVFSMVSANSTENKIWSMVLFTLCVRIIKDISVNIKIHIDHKCVYMQLYPNTLE